MQIGSGQQGATVCADSSAVSKGKTGEQKTRSKSRGRKKESPKEEGICSAACQSVLSLLLYQGPKIIISPRALVQPGPALISRLPYLAAVIKETLRLHPALPLLVPHCPSAACVVGGYSVPAGARVFFNVWAIHRDPEVWEDPLEFRPERFADGGEAGKRAWDFSGNDFRYLPFGSGRRMCAGALMAERMMLYMVATLVHSFEWRAVEGIGKKAAEDMEEKFGIVMKKARPLVLVPTPRLARDDLYL